MKPRHQSSVIVFCLLVCMITVCSIYGASRLERSSAQTEIAPITRHIVVHHALRYVDYRYTIGGQVYEHFPYCNGKGDSIDNIGEGGQGWPGCCDWFQHRLQTPSTTPGTNAGTDCSGYVSRVWGKPIEDNYCKWGTDGLSHADVSTPIPYADRFSQLPMRMRMGDIFDDPDNHVVLLAYFREDQPNVVTPVYYEEIPPVARLNETGGWNYVAGYEPYRYNQIRDDLYSPWLANAWYGWQSTTLIRNNGTQATNYVVQQTHYSGGMIGP
jgi:hypothetical protein